MSGAWQTEKLAAHRQDLPAIAAARNASEVLSTEKRGTLGPLIAFFAGTPVAEVNPGKIERQMGAGRRPQERTKMPAARIATE